MATKSRSRKERKNPAEATADPFPSAEEMKTYDVHLPEWGDREGQFVVIKGREILGFFPRDEEALEAGYDQVENGPFLVKQILRYEPIYNVSTIDL
jgi:hypothetical protein